MSFSPELHQELDVLAQFDPANHQRGIKIHKNAQAELIEAARRLYEKGLISQSDGGYLTRLGIDVVEHLQAARTILADPPIALQRSA